MKSEKEPVEIAFSLQPLDKSSRETFESIPADRTLWRRIRKQNRPKCQPSVLGYQNKTAQFAVQLPPMRQQVRILLRVLNVKVAQVCQSRIE